MSKHTTIRAGLTTLALTSALGAGTLALAPTASASAALPSTALVAHNELWSTQNMATTSIPESTGPLNNTLTIGLPKCALGERKNGGCKGSWRKAKEAKDAAQDVAEKVAEEIIENKVTDIVTGKAKTGWDKAKDGWEKTKRRAPGAGRSTGRWVMKCFSDGTCRKIITKGK